MALFGQRSREEQAAGKDGQQGSLRAEGEFSMEENSLYSSRDKGGRLRAGRGQLSAPGLLLVGEQLPPQQK